MCDFDWMKREREKWIEEARRVERVARIQIIVVGLVGAALLWLIWGNFY